VRLVWSAPALWDRASIYDYIEVNNPQAAAKLDARFSEVADRLCRHPDMGRPGRVSGTREFVAHPRYVLVYEWAEDTVHVLAIVHTSRRWPPDDVPGPSD
jgi:toxin ParE1/3/4